MFGNYFRSQREQRGLTIIEAAAQLGMSKSNLAKLETLPEAFSGVRKFMQLCTFYQTNPATLLTQQHYVAVHYSQATTSPINEDGVIKASPLGPHHNQAEAELYAIRKFNCSGRIGPVLQLTEKTSVIVYTTTEYQSLLEQPNE